MHKKRLCVYNYQRTEKVSVVCSQGRILRNKSMVRFGKKAFVVQIILFMRVSALAVSGLQI